MNVLLINPDNKHIIESNFPKEIDEESGLFSPLGLLYIASFLKSKKRHSVSILDMQAQHINLPHLKNIIKERMPDIVGIYTTTFHLIDVFLTAKTIKEINPDIYITLGGPHATIYPDETIANDNVDFVILGEGEFSFSRLVDALEEKKSFTNIKGIVYKNNDKIIKTGPPEFIHDLDMLPFPDRRMTPYRHCYNILSHDYPSTSMISSRGCPYKCTFCYHSHLGKQVRFRGCDNIISEIEECLDLGIKDIFFCDDTFILDYRRTIDICNAIIRRRLKFSWGIRTRVDSVDIDILVKLKKAGCDRIQLGVESGSSKTLAILNKGITINQIKETFKLTKQIGIKTLAYFMLGSPTEHIKDVLDTIDFAIQLNPDYAHFTITTPYPGTDLYKRGLEKNIIKNDFWREFAIKHDIGFSPLFWKENLSEKELMRLLKYANRHFYLRPSYIFKMLLRLTSPKDLQKKIKMAIRLFKYVLIT